MSLNTTLEDIFTNIYNNNFWAMGQNDSKSGLGSSSIYTKYIKENLINTINRYNIKNMIDTSCGDWFWMKDIKSQLSCNYIGIDIVKEIVNINNINYANDTIKFIQNDFLSYIKSLPDKSVDLILCRHTCEHLPTEYIIEFINEVKRVSKFLLLTTHKNATENINLIQSASPYRPINLDLYPYVSILDKYHIDSMYDGPFDTYCSEMFINLYKFTTNN